MLLLPAHISIPIAIKYIGAFSGKCVFREPIDVLCLLCKVISRLRALYKPSHIRYVNICKIKIKLNSL